MPGWAARITKNAVPQRSTQRHEGSSSKVSTAWVTETWQVLNSTYSFFFLAKIQTLTTTGNTIYTVLFPYLLAIWLWTIFSPLWVSFSSPVKMGIFTSWKIQMISEIMPHKMPARKYPTKLRLFPSFSTKCAQNNCSGKKNVGFFHMHSNNLWERYSNFCLLTKEVEYKININNVWNYYPF